jgi:hypothetical protein
MVGLFMGWKDGWAMAVVQQTNERIGNSQRRTFGI